MNHKETLGRIIKYLMINYPFVADVGLMNGRMGGVLFFSYYAKCIGEDYFFDYADMLFESVFTSLRQDMPIDFANGLCGVGWAVEYILQNGLSEGEPDEVLEDIDKKVMERDVRRISDMSFDTGLEGILLYVITRLESFDRAGQPKPFDQSYIEELYAKAYENKDSLSPHLQLIKRLADIQAERPDFARKPNISDIISLSESVTVPQNLRSLPIGIKNGLTEVALQLIGKAQNPL